MIRPIVLIHGAWHGAWCWEYVVSGLEKLELQVTAVDLPFTSFADDIECARCAIDSRPGAVVVGHSYGGAVISQAASGQDISHLVYLAALMPDEGESIGALMASAPPTPVTEGMIQTEDGRTMVNDRAAREAFYADCAPEDIERALKRLRPIRFTPPKEETPKPAWHSTDSTYVVCKQDRALDPSLQRRFADRATNVAEWDTSHSPFVSRPDLLVDLLEKLARNTS